MSSLWNEGWVWDCVLLLYPFCLFKWEGGRGGCCEWVCCEGCWAACCWEETWGGLWGRCWMTWACGDGVWRQPSPWLPCSGSMEPEAGTGRQTGGPGLHAVTVINYLRRKDRKKLCRPLIWSLSSPSVKQKYTWQDMNIDRFIKLRWIMICWPLGDTARLEYLVTGGGPWGSEGGRRGL